MLAGVNLVLTPDVTVTFAHAGMLSMDGRCKVCVCTLRLSSVCDGFACTTLYLHKQALDASADGYGRAEAAGVLLLGPLSASQQDAPLAIVSAIATNQDGRSSSLTAPMGMD